MKKLTRYKELINIIEPTNEQRRERAELREILKNFQGTLAPQVRDAFREIESRRKNG